MNSTAQPAIGEWRAHLSYSEIHHVTGGGNEIYAATQSGIQVYYAKENAVETISTINGLSHGDISAIYFSPQYRSLFVGYKDGNLDVIKDNAVSSYPQIKNNAFFQHKQIHHFVEKGNQVFIACDFGIVEFIPESGIFRETIYPQEGTTLSIHHLHITETSIYAATERGIYYAGLSQDLSFPGNWNHLNALPNAAQHFSFVDKLGDNLFFVYDNPAGDDILYVYDQGGNVNELVNDQGDITSIWSNGSSLFVAVSSGVFIYDSDLNLFRQILDYPFGTARPNDLYLSSGKELWIGDADNGLVREIEAGNFEKIIRNGPASDEVFHIESGQGRMFATGGGVNKDYSGFNRTAMLYRFIGNTWQNIRNEQVTDLTHVAVDPRDAHHFYAGSWSSGLLEYLGNNLQNRFNQSNSPLVLHGSHVKVHSLQVMEEGDLLMVNYGAENPLVMKRNTGEWLVFKYEELKNQTIKQILWTKSGYLWGFFNNSEKIFIIDFNETLGNTDDDQVLVLSPKDPNGSSFADEIYALDEDREENIWIATDEGVVVEYDPQSVFQNNMLQPNRIRVTEGDITQYLMRDNLVNAMYIDPANRKWFATERSGVLLFSADGERLISNFTTENSPLFANRVLALSMNEKSGEIFFGTSRGMLSYRSKTAEVKDDFSETYVFPNPVKPGYEGPITITGLVGGVNLKITDISGNLVYETVSEGGQATWEGKDLNGKKVSTGVYLVFITNEDGSKTHIEKILFIR